MSAQPSQHDSHDGIRLGGETAVVVPVHEDHTLKALRDRASAEQVEEAEIDAAIGVEDGRAAGPEVARGGMMAVNRAVGALADDPALRAHQLRD